MEELNGFLLKYKEKADMNQYWYSKKTIDFLVNEIETNSEKAAFLSCPSVYFSLTNKEFKTKSTLFDLDTNFEKKATYVKYDFNHPEDIPPELAHQFDFILIDPPFITPEVWAKYAEAAVFLMKEDGKLLVSTISENERMLEELLGVKKQIFQPSIPNLVYQYAFYANYESQTLNYINQEIPQ